ncbi:MAG TPA: sulfate permease [Paracoccus sp.]|nr:sulfate permease [Paracoccus sp. (in: a-proteobacteria)]
MPDFRLPLPDWSRNYSRAKFSGDLIAALIVTVMLIPQGMAYAMLAGLPPQAGLYGAILPLLIYAALGSSPALAVGPVAVVALMTAAAAGTVAGVGTPGYHLAALWIALISGALMLVMGLLRLGFVANFLSHPVISGFITAAGLLIAASQIRHLLGIETSGKTLPEVVPSVLANLGGLHWPTLLVSALVLAFLLWSRKGLAPTLRALGLPGPASALLARGGLFLAVLGSTLAAWALGLEQSGLRIVGEIPRGLPPFELPAFDMEMITRLMVPSALIALVGYVESISIAQTLAARRRQSIDPDRELVALGAANIGAGMVQAMPVTGGLSRSIVNFDAGAQTPAAGALTALMIGAALIALTPLLYYLPNATLAAIIIVAVMSLLDFGALPRAWAYSKADGAAMAVTMVVTLLAGVEKGLAAGVGLSVVMHLYRTSRPHVAEVGQVPGTGHFRNVSRYEVVTTPGVVTLRVDESLYFPNARYLEDLVQEKIAGNPDLKHLVLMFSAVNEVDASALESLKMIRAKLNDAGVRLHLSEVKGPVMDRLRRTDFLDHVAGLYLTQLDAMQVLAPELTQETLNRPRHEMRKPGA